MARTLAPADVDRIHFRMTTHLNGRDFYEHRETCLEFPELTRHVRLPKGRKSKVPRSTEYFVAGASVAPASYQGATCEQLAAALTSYYAAMEGNPHG